MFRAERALHEGTDEELLAEVARLDGTADQLLADRDLVRLILPAIRNDYRVIETYRPPADAVLDIPLLCLTGDADPRVTREEAAAWKAHTVAEYQGDVLRRPLLPRGRRPRCAARWSGSRWEPAAQRPLGKAARSTDPLAMKAVAPMARAQTACIAMNRTRRRRDQIDGDDRHRHHDREETDAQVAGTASRAASTVSHRSPPRSRALPPSGPT
ncbi:hypothetical protein SRIMM317S_01633 [Streptomyces rimosus subsp. rimosus]